MGRAEERIHLTGGAARRFANSFLASLLAAFGLLQEVLRLAHCCLNSCNMSVPSVLVGFHVECPRHAQSFCNFRGNVKVKNWFA
jgi:hypothetical protein